MATNSDLKKFAQSARRLLREQVAGRLEQVLRVDSVEVREKKNAVDQLKKQIAEHSKAEVIDKVAYIWFNRFCALRYMDVNLYNPVRVVSPAPGNVQPELLQEAKASYLPEEWKKFIDSEKVFGLLNGSIRAENGQQEAYRRLLVGVCNAYARIMPFMFEAIEDYTELLMPQDLLSENAVLTQTRLAMSDEACQDVEVIGWLYQYYISERKDEVFEQVKNGKKIEAEDIPAVTQLFTPHWIVRYLVENSLGRLWLLNHPDSRIIEKMEYYIKPVDEETDYLKVTNPEELKICDPACGSGHILTYTFDLIYAIYEEQGYDPIKISSLILEKNLYGIEIDERAGALAAFALVMKARGKDKRFFTRGLQPNVCLLENVSFSDQEIKEYTHAVGRDLFTDPLLQTLKQFDQAKNFGSLIQPVLTNPGYIQQVLEEKNLAGNLFLFGIHEKVMKVLKQSEYLSPRYQVAVANPPYMGISGANEDLKGFARDYYPDSRTDLFAMFIERNLAITLPRGFVGMITMQTWMFLSSFEVIRKKLIQETVIISMAHLGARAFDSIGGEVVSTTAFVLKNDFEKDRKSVFIRLVDEKSESDKDEKLRLAIRNPDCGWFYYISKEDFQKIPGCPFAYWIGNTYYQAFSTSKRVDEIGLPKQGTSTGNNDLFLRFWFEVGRNNIDINCDSQEDSTISNRKWYPATKGGTFRKWFGNNDYVINWKNNGEEIRNYAGSAIRNPSSNFKEALTWTGIGSSRLGIRYCPKGFVFTVSGKPIIFSNHSDIWYVLAILASNVAYEILQILTPSLSFEVGYICMLPVISTEVEVQNEIIAYAKTLCKIHKDDWDAYENSWEFSGNLFLKDQTNNQELQLLQQDLMIQKNRKVDEARIIEEKINGIIVNLYGLEKSILSSVPIEQITLFANPYYRYGSGKTEEEYKRLQLADTKKEFISYAVGCMFGRYSLDKPGLILANQGETLQDYLRQAPDPTFLPDEDNVIPVIGGDWFQDDITERFKKFLKVTFGEEHYSENLQFIEEAIGRDIESYFLKDFYDYHVKMYKKRPIYWMFSSPKGTFNALIYMHRYNKDTVSILLNDYLKQFRVKLESRKSYAEKLSISASGSQRERTIALKELETLKKQLEEITTYENKVIFPLATKQIEIDLDDGVKANYPKFGEALVPIKGL